MLKDEAKEIKKSLDQDESENIAASKGWLGMVLSFQFRFLLKMKVTLLDFRIEGKTLRVKERLTVQSTDLIYLY